MMHYKSFSILLMIAFIPSALASNAKQMDCNKAYTQRELNNCAQQALSKSQQQLDKIYKQALQIAINMDRDNSATTSIKHSLLIAQASWQQYQQANCKNVLAIYQDSSEANLQYLACEKQMVGERIQQLQQQYLSG